MTQSSAMKKIPWYKEPMVWLAFSPAIFGVIVGLTLLTIGVLSYDGPVHEDYYREGRTINQSFERDRVARDLGLRADVRFTGDQVVLNLSGDLADFPHELVVLMENATRSSLDFSVPLRHIHAGQYVGDLPQQAQHQWDVKLYGPEREWRLYGRAEFPMTRTLVLQPSQR
ncbi:FixH family protein [Marinospirillum sp.]|uniref:FixH family protein n=1 Tax=Marinospirillum sp. TaxID=2183934 RepID=UPI003A8AFD00